jgi:pimeloyl-ACP methyl ester carboxylesterase
VPFRAGDGFACNLIHIEGDKPAHKGAVLLVHGAGVRASIFQPPVARGILDLLLDAGYDVWLENWRASVDHAANPWTLDQAALYDHPQAVKTVVRETGRERIQAIVHCQGSTSFVMSAVAGLVPEVETIVSNAVSLHPVVPAWSRAKLRLALPLLRLVTDYLDCRWGLEAPTPEAQLVKAMVELVHRECDNPVCKQVSFTYGSGSPALWRHENLDDATHEWIQREFAWVPLAFFEQIRECVVRGRLVSVEGHRELPEDFTAHPPQTDARFAFFAGESNQCFLAESQVRTYRFFERLRPGFHSLHVAPGYSHLDMFIGERAAAEVLPVMVAELDRTPHAGVEGRRGE